jgi:hypothetical protein
MSVGGSDRSLSTTALIASFSVDASGAAWSTAVAPERAARLLSLMVPLFHGVQGDVT